MASTYLTRTFSAGNQKTFTFSAWVKFADDSSIATLFATGADSENRLIFIRHDSGSGCGLKIDGKTSTTQTIEVRTNRAIRDPNAWYHIVMRVDTTESTDSDRVRIYVNGELETSLAQSTYPSLNHDTELNKAAVHAIGRYSYSASNFFNGCMSHVHFADGQSLPPTTFGETDSTTGIWKIKTAPSFTLGTNGFSILKDDATITDQSSNSNNFTLAGGTLTPTQDNPSNVFATLNPLDNYYAQSSFTNAARGQTSSASDYGWVPSTLGMTSGKWYAECKQTGFSGGSNYDLIGVTAAQNTSDSHYLGQQSYTAGYYAQGNVYNQSGSATSTYASYTTGDIIGVALDLDNNALYFSKNGSWQNSGDPTSGASKTGALSITAVGSTTRGAYFFASGDYGNTVIVNNAWNFGDGYFGTTAVSSAGTNATGIGIFEYDVPSGYKALCTKGLND